MRLTGTLSLQRLESEWVHSSGIVSLGEWRKASYPIRLKGSLRKDEGRARTFQKPGTRVSGRHTQKRRGVKAVIRRSLVNSKDW